VEEVRVILWRRGVKSHETGASACGFPWHCGGKVSQATAARIELMAGGGMVTSRRIVKVGDPYQVTAIGRRKNGESYCLRNWMKKFLFFCSGYGRNSLGRRDSEGAELSRQCLKFILFQYPSGQFYEEAGTESKTAEE